MGFHRLRMHSSPMFALNVAFGTSILVCAPSYYFCFRRREHKEQTIELMMKANAFQHEEEMPEPVPIKEHPFLDPSSEKAMQKEFVARLKERKDWQKPPPLADQDASKVFKEISK
uniref:Cytochrome c oxidase assembly protein COX20, mitochondrial n=1 Tax=Eucampia antarctica TaxID=49252 RepID=A0A7S2RND7_9STRA|mmetsp:Transcript_24606/g.23640  ORF Transcript_24606/g.23640 Transcript_24606/m.23640 type:complete len:115 (+) Transcript_24606:1-345(+)